MRPLPRQRRGFVLILALIIVFAIASLVVTLGRLARTEALASANQLATYEAANVARGAEQYVRAIASDLTQLATLYETDFEAVPVGTGYFWIVRPDYLDDELPRFGLVDEAAKIPLNNVTPERLSMFPSDMTPDIATAIVEWRGGIPDSGRYSTSGYTAKNAPFETVEELMLVQGITREIFYGEVATAATEGGAAPSMQVGVDAPRSGGWRHFFTTRSSPQTNPPPTNPQAPPAVINVNEAPRDVLVTLLGITEGEVDTGLAQRATAVNADPTSKEWAVTAFTGVDEAIRNRYVPRGTVFSADIVAVAGNGRAFKRVRLVIDATIATAPPRIVYRRDVTGEGFPLDASILTSLRAGQSPAGDGSSSRMGSSAR